METNPYLIDFYNHYDEDSRLALRHGTVEFLTTMRYIERYIKPGDRVLEIGAEPDGILTRWRAGDMLSTRRTYLYFRTMNTILRCYWGRCTIFTAGRINGRLCARRSA